MPRAAGSSTHYEFVLRRATGSYDRDTVIRLPSVTHIIGSVVAKPLDGWVYKVTRDNISGLVSVLTDDGSYVHVDHIIDMMTDADMLAEYMKENRLRPEDVAEDASERGTREHAMLEGLCKAYLESDETAAEQLANRTLGREAASPWAKAIAGWWLERYPRVVASEDVLYSLSLGCAGTADLVWRDEDGQVGVTDLKTRGEGKPAYRSDFIQVDGYAEMWTEMTGDTVVHQTVLIAREDGTVDEYDSPLKPGSFRKVKALYDDLKGVR